METCITGFLPWLLLDAEARFGELSFSPADRTDEQLLPDIARIVSGYVDTKESPIRHFTLIRDTSRSPDWNLDYDKIGRYDLVANLLFVSCCENNEYFHSLGGYCNSTMFQPRFQRFRPDDSHLALRIRRSDGETMIGGYEHGKFRFSMPVECFHRGAVRHDQSMLDALSAVASTKLGRRIETATSDFVQAFTDGELSLLKRELATAVSAAANLINKGTARDFALEIANLLLDFQCGITGGDVASTRPGVSLSKDGHDLSAYPCEGLWALEAYDLRSYIVHGKDLNQRGWGWSIVEHLQLIKFIFPKLIKLLLAKDRFYELTPNDKGSLKAFGQLLAVEEWMTPEQQGTTTSNWSEILSESKFCENFRASLVENDD